MVILMAIILVLDDVVKYELAMGFLGPERNGMLEQRGIDRYLMGHSDLPAPLP